MSPLVRTFVPLLPAAIALGQALRHDGVPSHLVAATYDPTRGTVVHLGQGGLRELVGNTWRTLPTNAPTDVFSMSLLASPAQRALFAVRMLGGSNGNDPETWRFDGVTWTRLAIPLPTPRLGAQIAWDPVRDRAVLFGGFDPQTGGLNDTWTFDGTAWQQRQPAFSPPVVMNGAMAFDMVRQRMILVDGEYVGDLRTFAWNGANWSAVITTTSPPARAAAGLVYDLVRDRIVLVGGGDLNGIRSDCWEFDGADWYATVPMPVARQWHPFVFDLGQRRSLLLGGFDAGMVPQRDVWSWNGTTWTVGPSPANAPPPVVGAAVAVEPGGASVLLAAGGIGPQFPSYRNATWRWDGTGWTELLFPSVPSEGALAWAQNGQMFLFGGHQYTRGPNGRRVLTFVHAHSVWTATGWQAMQPVVMPAPRADSALAVDTVRNRALLFGGFDATTVFDDTWTFDGANWQLQSPAARPGARYGHSMAYDAPRDRIVLHGGFVFGPAGSTWEWNGSGWNAVNTATAPDAGSLVFDPDSQRVLLFVQDPAASPTGTALWSYDGIDWSPRPLDLGSGAAGQAVGGFAGGVLVVQSGMLQRYRPQPARVEGLGVACSAAAPVLSAAAWPDVGQSGFGLQLHGVPANGLAAIAGSVVSVALPLFGCTLLVDPAQALVFVAASQIGAASLPLPVPQQANLVGAQLFFQAATLSNLGTQGVALSRGLRVVIGR